MSKKWIGIAMTGSLILGACGMGTQTPTKPVDTTKPTGQIVVAAGNPVAGVPLVQVNAQDNVGVASVKLLKNGKEVKTLKQAPYAFYVDTTDVNGVLKLSAVVTDTSGNTATFESQVDVVPTSITSNNTNISKATALALIPGQTVKGTTSANTETAWYKLDVDGSAVSPKRLILSPRSTPGSTLDVVLRLYDADGKLLTESDGGGAEETDPDVTLNVTTKTTYYAVISSYLDKSKGEYQIASQLVAGVGDASASVNVGLNTTKSSAVSESFGVPAQTTRTAEDTTYKPGEILALVDGFNHLVDGEISTQQVKNLYTQAAQVAQKYNLELKEVASSALGLVVFKAPTADVKPTISALKADPSIRAASPNYIRHPLVANQMALEQQDQLEGLGSYIPNDPRYHQLWGLKLINAPQTWTMTKGNNSITVAVVDTGIAAKIGTRSFSEIDSPDLLPNLVPGYDFISGEKLSASLFNPELLTRFPNFIYDDRDSDVGPDPYPFQEVDSEKETSGPYLQNSFVTSAGHGSHVAGTIGAVGDNSVGVAGVSWNVKLQPIRTLTDLGGSSSDIMNGVLYAAGVPVTVLMPDGSTKQVKNATPARVINLSLGGGGYSEVEEAIFDILANQRNVVVVAAAGNEKTDVPHYPSGYSSVISVSSVDYILDADGDPTNGYQSRAAFSAVFSNYGTTVDVAAPGGACWYTNAGYKSQKLFDPSAMCIGVSADGKYNYRAPFILSSYFQYNRPSTGLLTADNDGVATPINLYLAGTSMATPHVAGVVAQMLSVNPNLTPYQVREILRDTAQRVDDRDLTPDADVPAVYAKTMGKGEPNNRRDNYYGFGLVDAAAALEAVSGTKLPAAIPANAKVWAVLMAGDEMRYVLPVSRNALRALFNNVPVGTYKLVIGVDANNNNKLAEANEWVYESAVSVEPLALKSVSGTFGKADGKNPIVLPTEQPK